MTDLQFQKTLDRKLQAFRTMILATATLKGDDDSHFELIQSAYESLGRFLKEAMGEDSDPKPEDQEGSEKHDQTQAGSAWSTIKPVRQSGLNLAARTVKQEGAAWASIERVIPRNLDLGQNDDETAKADDQKSAWSSIRRNRTSGLEL